MIGVLFFLFFIGFLILAHELTQRHLGSGR